MDISPRDFLYHFFGDVLDEGLFGIFTLPDARTKWFQSSDKAGEYAANQSKCTYFTLGLFAPGVKKKGKEEDVIGLMCLHADIDIKDPAHQKTALPETEEEAVELAEQGIPGAPPTLIINSGRGVQAFWIFNEPWMFETREERLEAKRLTKSFHTTINYAAGGKGWGIDPTFNLERVMRVGGTTNYKVKDDPRPTYLIKSDGPLYNPDSFDDVLMWVEDEELQKANQQSFDRGDENPMKLTLSEGAVPPQDKLEEMMDAVPEVKLLFNKQLDMQKKRKKKDANGDLVGDSSLSSYDMSLANHAVIWGFSDQEVANLIIAFRRKHMTKPADLKKALRPKYITDLILKAKASRIQRDHDEGLNQFHEKVVSRRLSEDPEPLSAEEWNKEVKEAKVKIAAALQIRVESINKYLSEPPHYELVLADGQRVQVGSANNLLNQMVLRSKVFEVTNVAFVPKKKDAWTKVITAMGHLINEVDTSEDTRDEDAMRAWISDYIEEAGVWDDPDDAVADKRPFRANGKTYLFGQKLMSNINLKGGKYNKYQMGVILARLKCVSVIFRFKDQDGKQFGKRVYDVTPALEEAKDE